MPNPKYVMFQRGTKAAFQSLREHSLIDENTLYFIYDAAEPNKSTLYLGTRLIADGLGSDERGAQNLTELLDVQLTNLQAGDFLIKSASGKWINQTPAQVVQALKEASLENLANVDDVSISVTEVGKLQMAGFADAPVGAIPQVSYDSTLQANKITWITGITGDLDTRVGKLEDFVGEVNEGSTLQTVIGKAISDSNHLTYEIANSIDDVLEPNIIYLVRNTNESGEDKYDEYIYSNGAPERLGVFSSELSGYVKSGDFEAFKSSINSSLQEVKGTMENDYVQKVTYDAEVGNLTELVNRVNEHSTLVDEINALNQYLVWQDIASVET